MTVPGGPHLLTELAEDRQILLFTCQHREFFMLEDRPEITTVTLPDFLTASWTVGSGGGNLWLPSRKKKRIIYD